MKASALALFFTSCVLASCAQKDEIGPCPDLVVLGPESALDYPITTSTGVPDNVETLILSGTAPQKIELMPDVSGATPIATTPTSLPSPLPSPIATPYSGPYASTYGYFAVSVPRLSPMTAYGVVGLTTETSGCGGTSMIYAGTGSFTTQ